MKNNKRILYITSIVMLAFVFLFVGLMCIQIKSDNIAKNTYVEDINIGGLTKEEAKLKISEIYKTEDIYVKYDENQWSIKPENIDLTIDIDKTIQESYDLNRKENIIQNILKTIKTNFGERNDVNIDIVYNEEKINKELEQIAKEINIDVKDASIKVGSNISVTKEVIGKNVDIKKSIEELKLYINKEKKDIQLVVETIEPKIKESELKQINTVLGRFSTQFNSSVPGRTTNVKLATNRTSDILIMPGETFSFNQNTLKRTKANGYQDAPVIVQGVIQEGIGGGVCQVSSTIYNSVLYAGLEIVNVRNHSIPSSYIEKGRDAVVVDNAIDFVFRNNLEHPIYLKNYVSGGTIVCQVYGASSDKKKIDITTSIDQRLEAPIKKVDDASLPKGEEKVLEKARDGYTVSTYRIYKDTNGKVIKKEKVATSYYPKKQGVIAVGTKEETIEPPIEPPTVEPPVEEVPPNPIPPETTQPPQQESVQ